MADVKFRTTRVELPTSGTVDATISGFGTPKAAIVIVSNAYTTSNPAVDARFSVGFTDFTNKWCASFSDEDGADPADTARGQRTDCVVSLLTNAATEFVRYTAAVAAGGDGITLTKASGSTSAIRYATVILIGGDDVDVKVGNSNLGTGTTGIPITGIGFKPTLSFFTCVGDANTPPYTNETGVFSFGCAVEKNGAIQQGSSMWSAVDNIGTGSINNSYHADDAVIGQLYNESLGYKAGIDSFDTDGFTINPTAPAGSDLFGYLAIKITGGNAALKHFDWPTSGNTDIRAETQPQFALMSSLSQSEAANTVDTSSVYSYSVSAIDTAAQYTLAISSQDGVDPSDTESEASTSLILNEHAGALYAEATHQFHAGGMTLTYSDFAGGLRPGWCLLLDDGTTESSHKATVTIPSSAPDAQLTDYPAYVDLSHLTPAFWSKTLESVYTFDFATDPIGTTMTAQNGTFAVSGGKLTATGSSPGSSAWIATVDGASFADGDGTVTHQSSVGSGAASGLVFRRKSSDGSFLAVLIDSAGTGAYLFSFDGTSTWTQIGATETVPGGGLDTDCVLRVRWVGDTVNAYVNGDFSSPLLSRTTTFNQTETGVGVRIGSTDRTLDNLLVHSNLFSPGKDIRVFNHDGTTELPREVVSCDPIAKTGELHVLTDLSVISDTQLRIYADGVSSDYATDATYGAEAVWADYDAVYHGDDETDSTGGASLSTTGVTYGETGQVGTAMDIGGTLSDRSLTVSAQPVLLQAWAKTATTAANTGVVAIKDEGSGAGEQLAVTMRDTPDVDVIAFEDAGASFAFADTTNSIYTTGTFYKLDGLFLNSTSRSAWVNGANKDTDTTSLTLATGLDQLVVGPDVVADEVRVRTTTISDYDNWISTEYANQSDPFSFYTVSTPKELLTHVADVVIDATQINSTQTNFPAYIKPDSASGWDTFWSTVADGGADVRLYRADDNDNELPREIVSCATGTSTGEIHTLIDTLSSTEDTTISVYADGSMEDYDDAVHHKAGKQVWGDYALVTHDLLTDSTGNNTLTNDGGVVATGQMGDGLEFNAAGTDEVNAGSAAAIDDIWVGGGTASAWVRVDTDGENGAGRILNKAADAATDGWLMIALNDNGTTADLRFYAATSAESPHWDVTGGFTLGDIDHVVVTHNASQTSNPPSMYLGGTSQSVTTVVAATSATYDSDAARDFLLGNNAGGAREFDGVIDEVRLRAEELSADWIDAEYTNQATPTTFYTVTDQGAGGSGVYADFAVSYSIRELLSVDTQLLYQVAEILSSDFQAPYSILSLAAADAQLLAHIREAVSGDAQLLYDIISLGAVGVNLQLLANISETVSADAALPAHILELVSADAQLLSKIRELAGSNLQVLYDVIQDSIAGASLQLPSNISEHLASDFSLPSHILTAVAEDVELTYRVLELATADMQTPYSMRELATADLAVRYNLLADVVLRDLKKKGGLALVQLLQQGNMSEDVQMLTLIEIDQSTH